MVLRVTADWTGTVTGLASTSIFFIGDDPGPQDPATAQAAATRVRTFFTAIRPILAPGIIVTVNPVTTNLSTVTGQIQSQTGVDGGAPITAQGAGGFCRAAGALVRLTTSTFLNGRTVKGRLFIVPIAGEAWGTNGLLASSTLSTLGAAATALATAAGNSPVVWHRPKGGTGGSTAFVTSAQVPAQGAILASRRD